MDTSLKLAELHNRTEEEDHHGDDTKQTSSVSDMISKFNSSSGNQNNHSSPHVSPVRAVNTNFFNSSLEHEKVKTLAIHEDLMIDHQSYSSIQSKFITQDDEYKDRHVRTS